MNCLAIIVFIFDKYLRIIFLGFITIDNELLRNNYLLLFSLNCSAKISSTCLMIVIF